MLLWEGILFIVALAFLAIASYMDGRKREVADWLSYGLIFSGLGLRLVFSVEEGWGVLIDGLLGFLVCLGLAYLVYWANWWGGGDSKLLMGMGAVLGLGFKSGGWRFWEGGFDFSLGWFFLGLLFFGAIVALLWSLVLAVKKWREFRKAFKEVVGSTGKWQYLVLGVSLGFLVLGLVYGYFWLLTLIVGGSFYLLCFVKAVEESCFIKEVEVGKLVEGDWLAEEVVVGGKKVAGKKRGLEREEIEELKKLKEKGKLKKVWVKEGVPFVPSFLLSYLTVMLGGLIVRKWVLGWLGF